MSAAQLPAMLKALREQRRMTRLTLSIRAGVSEDAIRSFEKGKGLPSAEVLARLAAALGADVGALAAPPKEAA
ncbi:helix-turn-helix transcriptional regulator [Streptomyces macrosporus]|uniref:HTH cro/C1-type domain-containing protein n=1 Tax=Streptomyces macrosporus TaxID=44032 RepID=A0ABP5XBS6_9ACTN